MPRQRLMLAVDIGTSGARALLFDERAETLFQTRQPYSMSTPQAGWNEQDPQTVAAAVLQALKEAVTALPPAASLEGVVFSSQLYSILALDRDGSPLTPSLTWADTRSAGTAAILRKAASKDLFLRTGCPLQAIYPLAKIHWLKTHHELAGDTTFVSIKDYVLLRLTGQITAEWSSASASGLLNIATYQWDAEALELAGITRAQLPELASPRQMMRRWQSDVSEYTGIPDGTPLILGAGDAPLANIGVGATGKGSLALNIGTSAAVRMFTAQPQVDSAGRLWTYAADEGRWVTGGMIGSGGAVYEWLLKKLLLTDLPPEGLFQEAEALASSAPPGADGLLFIPYLSGEQSPGWKPQATGVIDGLTFRHERSHVLRAAVEGIAFALLRAAQPLAALQAIEAIYMTGGLTAFPTWPQTIASVFGAPVVVPASLESSARGAAILGWLALGAASAYDDFAQPEKRVLPEKHLQPLYQERFRAFCDRLNKQETEK